MQWQVRGIQRKARLSTLRTLHVELERLRRFKQKFLLAAVSRRPDRSSSDYLARAIGANPLGNSVFVKMIPLSI